MKKIIGRFQYVDCTAIAISAGDSGRQDSVLIRDVERTWVDDEVLFGWTVADIPNTQEEIETILMGEYPSADCADLDTVFIDDRPLSEYVSGQL